MSRTSVVVAVVFCLMLWASPVGAQSGPLTEFSLPSANSGPSGIVAGPDGNVWFTEISGNRIGRITPKGVITEFTIPTADSRPTGITRGPDDNLWFTEDSGNQIGRITPE